MESKAHKFRRLAGVLEGYLEKEQFLIRKGQIDSLADLMPRKAEITNEVAALWQDAGDTPDFPLPEDTELMEELLEGYKVNESLITEALNKMRHSRRSANQQLQRFRTFRMGASSANPPRSQVNLSA